MRLHHLGNDTARRTQGIQLALLVGALTTLTTLGVATMLLANDASADSTTIQVYKTPTCGCCTKWIDHLRDAGFDVEATDMPDLTALKAMNGVPNGLTSCHTAMVEGYVIEGHVPASDITKLLAERPKIAGLAVPGMPMGSPGMEHPDPSRHESFDVLAFGAVSVPGEDRLTVFSTHAP
jgi:hypothetical protein